MTNTIPNVPRELLERARAAVASTNTSNWSSDLLRDIHALLSAPSPAGVYSADPLACSGCASGCFRCRCVTMQRAVSECGCPDCGSSLIAWPEGIDSEGGSCD